MKNREKKFKVLRKFDSVWEVISLPDDLEGDLHMSAEAYDFSTFRQFTDLKDKNGVDIYEDDILSVHVDCIGEDQLFAVKFGNRQDILLDPCQEADSLLCGFYLESVKELGQVSIHDKWNMDETEIVGNLFENPELLTSQLDGKEKN